MTGRELHGVGEVLLLVVTLVAIAIAACRGNWPEK